MPLAPQKVTKGPQMAPRPDDPMLAAHQSPGPFTIHSQCVNQPALQGRVPGN